MLLFLFYNIKSTIYDYTVPHIFDTIEEYENYNPNIYNYEIIHKEFNVFKCLNTNKYRSNECLKYSMKKYFNPFSLIPNKNKNTSKKAKNTIENETNYIKYWYECGKSGNTKCREVFNTFNFFNNNESSEKVFTNSKESQNMSIFKQLREAHDIMYQLGSYKPKNHHENESENDRENRFKKAYEILKPVAFLAFEKYITDHFGTLRPLSRFGRSLVGDVFGYKRAYQHELSILLNESCIEKDPSWMFADIMYPEVARLLDYIVKRRKSGPNEPLNEIYEKLLRVRFPYLFEGGFDTKKKFEKVWSHLKREYKMNSGDSNGNVIHEISKFGDFYVGNNLYQEEDADDYHKYDDDDEDYYDISEDDDENNSSDFANKDENNNGEENKDNNEDKNRNEDVNNNAKEDVNSEESRHNYDSKKDMNDNTIFLTNYENNENHNQNQNNEIRGDKSNLNDKPIIMSDILEENVRENKEEEAHNNNKIDIDELNVKNYENEDIDENNNYYDSDDENEVFYEYDDDNEEDEENEDYFYEFYIDKDISYVDKNSIPLFYDYFVNDTMNKNSRIFSKRRTKKERIYLDIIDIILSDTDMLYYEKASRTLGKAFSQCKYYLNEIEDIENKNQSNLTAKIATIYGIQRLFNSNMYQYVKRVDKFDVYDSENNLIRCKFIDEGLYYLIIAARNGEVRAVEALLFKFFQLVNYSNETKEIENYSDYVLNQFSFFYDENQMKFDPPNLYVKFHDRFSPLVADFFDSIIFFDDRLRNYFQVDQIIDYNQTFDIDKVVDTDEERISSYNPRNWSYEDAAKALRRFIDSSFLVHTGHLAEYSLSCPSFLDLIKQNSNIFFDNAIFQVGKFVYDKVSSLFSKTEPVVQKESSDDDFIEIVFDGTKVNKRSFFYALRVYQTLALSGNRDAMWNAHMLMKAVDMPSQQFIKYITDSNETIFLHELDSEHRESRIQNKTETHTNEEEEEISNQKREQNETEINDKIVDDEKDKKLNDDVNIINDQNREEEKKKESDEIIDDGISEKNNDAEKEMSNQMNEEGRDNKEETNNKLNLDEKRSLSYYLKMYFSLLAASLADILEINPEADSIKTQQDYDYYEGISDRDPYAAFALAWQKRGNLTAAYELLDKIEKMKPESKVAVVISKIIIAVVSAFQKRIDDSTHISNSDSESESLSVFGRIFNSDKYERAKEVIKSTPYLPEFLFTLLILVVLAFLIYIRILLYCE